MKRINLKHRLRNPGTFAKSLVAGLAAAVTAAVPYSSDGVNLQEGLIILGAFLAAQQATYWTPNKDETGTHQDESVQPPKPDNAHRRYNRGGIV